MQDCLVYIHGLRTQPKVVLTFDDGPNPPCTEQVMAILEDHGIHAAFFVFGKWAERFPRTVERLLAAGHVVGNHGHSGQRLVGDFDDAEIVISHLTGRPSRFLRAHTFNHAIYFQSVVAHLPLSRAIGLDVDGADWCAEDADTVVRNVLESPRLGPGSIINLHDGAEFEEASVRLKRAQPMLEALPRIIAGLEARGLACVGLDELVLAPPVTWHWGEGIDDLHVKADQVAKSTH